MKNVLVVTLCICYQTVFMLSDCICCQTVYVVRTVFLLSDCVYVVFTFTDQRRATELSGR